MSSDFLDWKNYHDPNYPVIASFSTILVLAIAAIAALIVFFKNGTTSKKMLFQGFFIFFLLLIVVSICYLSFTNIGDNTTEGINTRYNYSWFMCLAIPFLTTLTFKLSTYIPTIKDKLVNCSNSLILSLFVVLTLLSLYVYSVFYSIHLMESDNNFFPLYNDNYENITDKSDAQIIYKTLSILGIVWMLSFVSKYLFNSYDNNKILIYILIAVNVILAALLITSYTEWDQNQTEWLLAAFVGSFISLLMVYYLPDDGLKLSTVLTLAFTIIVGIMFSCKYSIDKANKNYSVYLVTSNYLILFCIFLSLIFAGYTSYDVNFQNLKSNSDYNFISWLFILASIASFGFSALNMYFSLGQKIKQDSSLNGTQYEDYYEDGYDRLSIFMFLFYTFTFFIGLFITIYLLVNYSEGSKRKEIAKFLSFRGDFTKYNIREQLLFSLLLLLIVNIFYYFSLVVSSSKIYSNRDFKTEELLLPTIIIVGLIILNQIIKYFFKIEYLRNTFFFSLTRAATLIVIYFLPIVLFSLYVSTQPKFYYKLNSNSVNRLVFADNKEKNAIPILNKNFEENSIFSVDSNFVKYGNGLFLTGGETNLDIDGLRGVRYVENQSSYYNFKYLNGDTSSFQNIVKENDVNLFTLAINDVSYGTKNDSSDAYWVAVGENVGLTDSENNSIFYNTDAGTTTLFDVPEVSTLTNWKPASNTFSFKGSGVTAGMSSEQNIWVSVGQDSVDYSESGDSFNTIKYSEDGINWNNATGVSFSAYGNNVAYGPSGLNVDGGLALETFVAVGYDYINSNHIVYSHNGRDWEAATGVSFVGGEGKSVVYGMSNNGTSGIWVAVGVDDTNPIKYSINGGTNWLNADDIKINKQIGALDVIYNLKDNRFEVVGKKNKHSSGSGILYYSYNGKEWSQDTDLSNNLLEATALGYNKGIDPPDNVYGDNYDLVYYPEYSLNKYFFTNKKNNKSLDVFNQISLIFSFIILISGAIVLGDIKTGNLTGKIKGVKKKINKK